MFRNLVACDEELLKIDLSCSMKLVRLFASSNLMYGQHFFQLIVPDLQVTLRAIDSAVKTMGATSEYILEMIENCPHGAETLAARVVYLLTERSKLGFS